MNQFSTWSYMMHADLFLVPTFFAPILLASALPGDISLRSADGPPGPSRHPSNFLTDQCGPSSQLTDAPSTCGKVTQPNTDADGNWSVSALNQTTPSTYGVNCINDHTGEINNFTSCEGNLKNLCSQLQNPNVTRGQWLWSSGGPNCTFGTWLPVEEETSAPTPTFPRCTNLIMEPMARWCGFDNHGRSNVATVNLAQLPTLNFTGRAVDANYPSYIMVAETYDDVTK